jgi:hypothetical protein
MIPMSTTLWHKCSPEKHLTDCNETMTLTAERPKTAPGALIVEFHPPSGKEPSDQNVKTEEALRWPHVVNYS